MQLTVINRYPVKSCRGEALDAAEVEPWGLAGDRRWMVVDADGLLVTAREEPRLLLVVPELRPGGGLRLTGPGLPPLDVPAPTGPASATVQVWKSSMAAQPADAAAGAWFGALLERTDTRLVFFDDPTRRRPTVGGPADSVSFADGYPLLVTTTASLDALNDLIVAGPRGEEGPLPMTRFRPNIVVSGSVPWAEDGWRRLRVGDAVFRVAKGCARCVMTTIDPWTIDRGREPIATLARHRRWAGKTWFGLTLMPDTPGAVIRVGDEVEVLHAEPAPDGPPVR